MNEYKQDNVILLEEDDGSLYLYVQDEIATLAVQELAILDTEVDRIIAVCKQYRAKWGRETE
jgi:hypothetical protein